LGLLIMLISVLLGFYYSVDEDESMS
jgi:hypothetical protein